MGARKSPVSVRLAHAKRRGHSGKRSGERRVARGEGVVAALLRVARVAGRLVAKEGQRDLEEEDQ
jgi:hypothetical protein